MAIADNRLQATELVAPVFVHRDDQRHGVASQTDLDADVDRIGAPKEHRDGNEREQTDVDVVRSVEESITRIRNVPHGVLCVQKRQNRCDRHNDSKDPAECQNSRLHKVLFLSGIAK